MQLIREKRKYEKPAMRAVELKHKPWMLQTASARRSGYGEAEVEEWT